jgi:HK97 family phage portal protein
VVFNRKDRSPVLVKCLDPSNPDTTYTRFELVELMLAHLLLWGNAFVRKIRDSGGRIIDLRPMNPALVKVKVLAGEKIFVVTKPGVNGSPSVNVPLTTYEIMHVPGLGYDGLQGVSVLEYANRTLNTTSAADRLASRFYSKGTQLTGVINVKAPLDDQEQADAIRKRWLQKNAGLGNSSEVAVLDAETTFQPITIPPDQLQFLESRSFQRTEIATWFGVPPFLVNDNDKMTSWGAGIEQVNTMFVCYTLQQWLERVAMRMTRELVQPAVQYAEFVTDHLLRGTAAERAVGYGSAIQWGWMTRNEVRAKENLEPIDGLDAPLTPINMATGQLKVNPLTGGLESNPKSDVEGALTTEVKPGSGKQQMEDENV